MGISYLQASRIASEIAQERGEWSGAPLPIEGFALSIAEGFGIPTLDGACLTDRDDVSQDAQDDSASVRLINSWHCRQRSAQIMIFDDHGKRCHVVRPDFLDRGPRSIPRILAAFNVAQVQDVQAEFTAMATLQTMIKPHLFEAYALHGLFLESSKRSGIVYLFRKGFPTIALSGNGGGPMRVISALCLHPIGYYQDTFLGSMVPTDDIISHLVLMRADEHFFWRKANHHFPWDWRSGL